MFSRNPVIDVGLRYLMLLLGLSLMSLGIAFSIRSALGTTPISSLPYALSLLTPLSVGALMILLNLVFVALQILVLRRRFPPIQLLQIPVVVVFGVLNDAALWLLRDVTFSAYWQQWLLAAIGIVIVGIGVAFQVKAKATPLAGEGLILTLSTELTRRFGPKRPLLFGAMKIQFDTTLVLVSIAIGLIAAGSLLGVREGTIAAALCVGLVVQLTLRVLEPVRTVEKAVALAEDGAAVPAAL
ncbi:MAG: YczE/YyaS/YitT family protein [Dermabacteraceae bacterium]